MFFTREERLETLRACRDCPMCHHTDAIAWVTGKETNTPRGRGMALWGLEKGILSWDDDGVSDILYKSLLDGLAQEWCDGNYDHDELVIDGRNRTLERGKAPLEVVQVLKNIREKGNPYGLKEGGIETLVKGCRVEKDPEVILFFGSSARIHRPEIIVAVIKIMSFLKIPFTFLDPEVDSGFLFYQFGDFKGAADYGKWVAGMIRRLETSKLIVLSASDYRMFTTRYSRFGSPLPKGMNVIHITEFLNQLLKDKRLIFQKTIKEKVTYHDPCHLGRFTDVVEPPRELINAIAGPYFIEMEWNRKRAHCCGGGGGISFIFPEISEKISRIRVEEALREEAKILVTSCPDCKQMLNRAIQPGEIEIKDISEIIADVI